MQESLLLEEAENLSTREREIDVLTRHIFEQKSRLNRKLNMLEAGCGRKWHFDLKDLEYSLTGIDLDGSALELRKRNLQDLDVGIVGDLRTVELPESSFDLIFSSNVLEHVDGAEKALENMVKWLRPGGSLCLIFPNRDCAYSFVTRSTPFWVHVWYKRYIQRVKNAGKPGFDPYPVFFDKVVSRYGFHEFCRRHGLTMKAEYRIDRIQMKNKVYWFMIECLLRGISAASLGKLPVTYRNLLFIAEKPLTAADQPKVSF